MAWYNSEQDCMTWCGHKGVHRGRLCQVYLNWMRYQQRRLYMNGLHAPGRVPDLSLAHDSRFARPLQTLERYSAMDWIVVLPPDQTMPILTL